MREPEPELKDAEPEPELEGLELKPKPEPESEGPEPETEENGSQVPAGMIGTVERVPLLGSRDEGRDSCAGGSVVPEGVPPSRWCLCLCPVAKG